MWQIIKKKEWSKTKIKENIGKTQENKSFLFIDALSLADYFMHGGGRMACSGGDAPPSCVFTIYNNNQLLLSQPLDLCLTLNGKKPQQNHIKIYIYFSTQLSQQ